MQKLFSYLLIVAGLTVLPALAQLPPVTTAYNPSATSPSQPVAPPPNPANVPGLLNGYVSDETYKLRVGDTISFQILEDRILGIQAAPASLVVADSGEVDVPYIGRVMAVDKNSKQLAEEIKAALEKDYYKQATVVLSLNIANRLLGRVYIWGQVRNQGALDVQVNENLSAGRAILRAGGFADFANKKKVKVVRANPDPKGKNQTFDLNMTQILEEGKIEQDVVLQPNDLIIVPSRLINF